MMKKYLLKLLYILIIVFSGIFSIFSQPVVDSLYLELANAKDDIIRVDILNEITRKFRLSDPEKALEYNTSAFNLANELEYIPGIARAYKLLGTICRHRGDNILALNNYMKAMELYEQMNDSSMIARIYNFMGQICDETGDADKTLNYFNKALKIYQDIGDQEGLAIIRNNIAVIYRLNGKDSLALVHFKHAFEMNKEIDRQQGMGFTLMNIGIIHFNRNLFKKALNYYFLSLDHMLRANDKNGLVEVNHSIGDAYVQLEKFDSANYYLTRSINMAEKFNLLGHQARITKTFANYYASIGNCEAENKSLSAYIQIQDSVFSKNLDEKIMETEKKFEFEREIKDQEFELLEKSRRLKINRLQKYILLIILIALFMLGWVLFNRKKLKIKLFNEKLTVKDNELVNFAIYILQKNDLIHTFRKQLLQLEKRLNLEVNKKAIEEIINSIIFRIAISKDIEEFRDKLREMSEEFYSKLDQKYPGLTEKEKQLATLLRLSLSSKQMAVILDISPDSVDINRHRLRKKIGLSSEHNLIDFFNRI